MSVKNQLQEFFQKQGARLPEYVYIRTGGEDHCPVWKCQVKLWINGEMKILETEEEYCSKKEASVGVAKKAFNVVKNAERAINELREAQKIALRDDISHTFILLDLENVPHGYRDLCNRIKFSDEQRVSVVGFYNHSATHIRSKVLNESEKYSYKLHLIEARSSCSDAADVMMCMWVGELIARISKILIDGKDTRTINFSPCGENIKVNVSQGAHFRMIIVTKDHFGKALTELINGHISELTTWDVTWNAELMHSIDEFVE